MAHWLATDFVFMRRALELAALGRGSVSPNPLVGCVLVHNNRVIGEGWHRQYGQAHAEVNAVRTVSDATLLPQATAYVTLEPCAHFGKTPPCADLLVEHRVGRVVVCNEDPFPLVAGRGIEKLRAAGIAVQTGLLAEEGRALNARFFTWVEKERPYIILKWAESADGFLAPSDRRPVAISGALAHQLVHKWRTEEDAILVGTATARHDNPRLSARHWQGRHPARLVIDRRLELSAGLHLFDGSQPTRVYYQTGEPPRREGVTYVLLRDDAPVLPQLLADLYRNKLQSVMVEGGAALLESFLAAGLWDEARVFRSPNALGTGVAAPPVRGRLVSREKIGDDWLTTYHPTV